MSETRNSNLLGIALIVIVVCSLSAEGKYGGGSGEPNDPYLIYDANHMQAIGADANDWDECFKLMADIDLSAFDGNDGRPEFNIIAPDINDEGKDPYYGMSVYGRLIHELLCLERSPDLKKVDHKINEQNDVCCCLIMVHKLVQSSAMTAGAGTGSKKSNIMAAMQGISSPIVHKGASW